MRKGAISCGARASSPAYVTQSMAAISARPSRTAATDLRWPPVSRMRAGAPLPIRLWRSAFHPDCEVIAVDRRHLARHVIEAAHVGIPARHDHAVIAAAGAAIDRIDRRRHQRDAILQPVRQRIAAGLRDEEVGRQPQLVEIAVRHVRGLRHVAQAGRAPVPRQALPPGSDRGPALRHVVHRDHRAHGDPAQNVTGLAAMVPGDCATPAPIR